MKDPENILAIALALLLWHHHYLQFAFIGLLIAIAVVWWDRNYPSKLTVAFKILVVYVALAQQIVRIAVEYQDTRLVTFLLKIL